MCGHFSKDVTFTDHDILYEIKQQNDAGEDLEDDVEEELKISSPSI